MSNKAGKVILISTSILAGSALVAISLKKVVDSIDSLRNGEPKEKFHKHKYCTIKYYEPSKDHAISSIKSAINSNNNGFDN